MAKLVPFPQRPDPPRLSELGAEDNFPLPQDLPRPINDGACDHLTGMRMPSVSLPSTSGRRVDLGTLSAPTTIMYSYVSTGLPGRLVPHGWDMIPGARGGTPQTRAFREHHQEFVDFGVEVFGFSAETPEHQQEMVGRLWLPFEVLSDAEFTLSDALRLPTFEAGDIRFIKRLTLVVRHRAIQKVFYPVFPPNENADRVLYWLRNNPGST